MPFFGKSLMKPKALRAGDTVRLVSPSRHAPDEWIEAIATRLEAADFRVQRPATPRTAWHTLAAPDEVRAAELMAAFTDPEVDAILCTRGGTGAYRILSHLDYAVIRRHPKIFCGFSDITTLHAALYRHVGLVTFQGPMGYNFGSPHDEGLFPHLIETLTGRMEGVRQKIPAKVLREGVAQGRLCGGTTVIVQSLIGTAEAIDPKGALLVLEDVEEKDYTIDRTLWHLSRAGQFASVAGVMIGEYTDTEIDSTRPFTLPFTDTLRSVMPARVPVIYDAPFGHGEMLMTLPFGITARLEAGANGEVFLTPLEKAFAQG